MSYNPSKKFISYLKKERYGFTVEGKLHIYVGGSCTSWSQLIPLFKKSLIDRYKEYKKYNNG